MLWYWILSLRSAYCKSYVDKHRVAHFGELAPQCVKTYYKYGCALLYKAQEEADPLGNVPKKEGESQQESANAGPAKNVLNGESSTASVSSNAEQVASPILQEGALDDGGMSLVTKLFFMIFLL